MDLMSFNILSQGMDQIMAENQLLNMDYSIYPVISDKDRRKSHKKWYKQAFPSNFEERVVKTSDLELI